MQQQQLLSRTKHLLNIVNHVFLLMTSINLETKCKMNKKVFTLSLSVSLCIGPTSLFVGTNCLTFFLRSLPSISAISTNSSMGPSIKYVTLFLTNLYPLPLSHFVTYLGTSLKVR